MGVAVAAVMGVQSAHAGKLKGVRSEVRGSSSSSSSKSSGSSSSSSSSSSSTSSSPTWGSSSAGSSDPAELDIDFGNRPTYPRFPYEGGSLGYVDRGEDFGGAADADRVTRKFAGRAHVEGAYLYDSLYRTGFALDLNWRRLGVKTDLSLFLEGPLKDALYLGSTNAQFALFMRPRLRWRLGGGAQYMIDARLPGQESRDYATGANLTTDVDVFPFWPVVLSGRFDYGTIYKATSMLGRGTLGLSLQGFELFGGYEYRAIGDVALHGPTVGLRAWF